MNRRLAQQFKNLETNFSTIIDQVIYYNSVDNDEKSFEIVQNVVNIEIEQQIKLLFADLKYRDYNVNPSSAYNAIWYTMAVNNEYADLLVSKLKQQPDKEFIMSYLYDLNFGYNDGYKTDEEFDIEDILYAIQKGEPINHRKKLRSMLKNIEISFSSLIDRIMFYDSIDQQQLAYDIIIEIEQMPTDKLIKLMIKELDRRDYQISTPTMYNFMWYYFADFHDKSNILSKELLNNNKKDKILNYLISLNERSESDSELNIQDVIDAVHHKAEITESNKLKVIFADIEFNFESIVDKMIHYEEKVECSQFYYFLASDISRKINNIDIDKRIDLMIEYTAKKGQLTIKSMFYNNLWRIISIHEELLKNKIKQSRHYSHLINHFKIMYKNEDGSINLKIIEIINKTTVDKNPNNKKINDISKEIIKQNKERFPELFKKDANKK